MAPEEHIRRATIGPGGPGSRRRRTHTLTATKNTFRSPCFSGFSGFSTVEPHPNCRCYRQTLPVPSPAPKQPGRAWTSGTNPGPRGHRGGPTADRVGPFIHFLLHAPQGRRYQGDIMSPDGGSCVAVLSLLSAISVAAQKAVGPVPGAVASNPFVGWGALPSFAIQSLSFLTERHAEKQALSHVLACYITPPTSSPTSNIPHQIPRPSRRQLTTTTMGRRRRWKATCCECTVIIACTS